MSTTLPAATPAADAAEPPARRWLALVFIALAQLIIAIDVTVVNVALPTVQSALQMPDSAKHWILVAYTLAFGSCLLVGGRLADKIGHRRAFLAALVAFGAASALCACATTSAVLVVGRALQGLSGAVLSPSALSLVNITFTERTARAKAFGVYSAVASSGMAAGFIVGGALTQYWGWRWAFWLSVACAAVAFAGGAAFLPRREPARRGTGFDIIGAVLSVTAVTVLVVGTSRLSTGSGAWGGVMLLGVGLVLLALFVLVQSRVRYPLLPLGVLTSKTRAGVYLSVMLAIMGLFGLFLLATYYLQDVRMFSPLETGLAFLPLVVAMALGATQLAARLSGIPPRYVLGLGFVLSITAILLMTRLTVETPYVALMLPAEIILGLGLSCVFVPCTNLSTWGVSEEASGVASAVYVTVQQIGAAIGTVILSGLSTTFAYRFARAHEGASPSDPAAVVHGLTSALYFAVALLVLGIGVAFLLVRERRGAGTGDDTSAAA